MAVTSALSKVAGGGGGGGSPADAAAAAGLQPLDQVPTQPYDQATLKYVDDKRRYDYQTQLWENNKAVQAYQNQLAYRQIEQKNSDDDYDRLRRVNEALALHRAKMASNGIDPSSGSVLAYGQGLLNEALGKTAAAKKLLALRKQADQSAIDMQLNPAGAPPSKDYNYWQASGGMSTLPPGVTMIEKTPDGQENYIFTKDGVVTKRAVSDYEF